MALPPGPKLPSLISSYEILSDPYVTLAKNFRKYGDIFTLRFINGDTYVFIVDPEAVKDKTTQTMYTDNSRHATFTLQIGPKSDIGIYDTQLEVKKDSYQSNFQQTNLRVV